MRLATWNRRLWRWRMRCYIDISYIDLYLICFKINVLILVEGAGQQDCSAVSRVGRDGPNQIVKREEDNLDYFTFLFNLRAEIIEERKGLEREVAALGEWLVILSHHIT